MRIITATFLVVMAVPALAANGNGQGPTASALKGSNGQSAEAKALGRGSVPLMAGAGSAGAATLGAQASTRGNGNLVPGLGNGLVRSGSPAEAEAGASAGGGEQGGTGGSSGGGLSMLAGGAGGGAGLVVDPALFADPALLDTGFEGETAGAELEDDGSAIVPVPVPATLPMLGLGLLFAGMVAGRRRG